MDVPSRSLPLLHKVGGIGAIRLSRHASVRRWRERTAGISGHFVGFHQIKPAVLFLRQSRTHRIEQPPMSLDRDRNGPTASDCKARRTRSRKSRYSGNVASRYYRQTAETPAQGRRSRSAGIRSHWRRLPGHPQPSRVRSTCIRHG